MPAAVGLVEVGPRDGLQSLPEVFSTEVKVELIEAIVDSGVRAIEAVSFAHPKVLPQLADAEQVMARLRKRAGVVYRGLVPNLKGAARAAACGVDEMVCLVSCDDEINLINQGMDVEATLRSIEDIAALADRQNVALSAVVALAFFIPGRGLTPYRQLFAVCKRLAGMGIRRLSLAASAGMADPKNVFAVVRRMRADLPEVSLGLHLHNRNGMALANAFAGMSAGAEWFEGSILGIGGDAWFPGELLGNAPMEDLVHMMQSMGVATGVDLEHYLAVARRAEVLLERSSVAFVMRGGTRDALARHRWSSTDGKDGGKP